MNPLENTVVVGIDLSMTSTGLALLTGDGYMDAYAIQTDPNTGTQIERQSIITSTVMKNIREFELVQGKVDTVFMEGYSMSSRFGQVFTLGELGGIMKYRLIGAGYRVGVLPPSSVKKFIGAGGGADKKGVAAAMKEHYGVEFDTTDQTDAAVLAIATHTRLHYENWCANFESRNTLDIPKHQMDALSKLSYLVD